MSSTSELCVIASWDDSGLDKSEVDGYIDKLMGIVERITAPENWDLPVAVLLNS